MSKMPDDIKEMNARILKAKKNIGIGSHKSENQNGFNSQVFLLFQLVIEIVSGTFVGAALGYILDDIFDFRYLFLLIFTIFGSFAGILNAHRYLDKQDKPKEGK